MNTAISEASTANHPVVTRALWIAERKTLLAREKELTRLHDQVARERRALPWVRIDKNYVFDAPEGPRTLARPLADVERFRHRMGWRFRWVSSQGSDFNPDFGVSFTPQEQAAGKVDYNYGLRPFPAEEAPGISVFVKDDAGQVFHTYSTYGRGVEVMMGAYRLMDLTPKGRDENDGPYKMDWGRHHDRYASAPAAKAAPAVGSCCRSDA